jgi:glycosyltransferase involved in cell wall biosynthesis
LHIVLTGNTTFMIGNFRKGLIKHFIKSGHRVTVMAPVDDYVPIVRELGCNFVSITIDRNGTSVLKDLTLLRAMSDELKKLRPDIVLSFTIKNNIYGGLACRFLKIPFVPNVTGLGPAFNSTGPLNIMVRFLLRHALKKAHKIFFQNADDKALFVSTKLVPPDRVELLPGSGVNLKDFDQSALPKDTGSVRFLLVTRMLWDKGVGIFEQAAAEVRTEFPNAVFQLLGPIDGASKTGISKAQISEWEAQGHVQYIGVTSDVSPFLAQSHCVVLPSFYREGTPKSLLEAGATGRPIITTDMPGCRDLVPDGKNGFIVEPRSVQSLISAFRSFLHLSEDERQTFGSESRKLIEEKYDEKYVITAYQNVLSELLK